MSLNLDTTISQLQDIATKLSDISGEVSSMVVLDGTNSATQDMSDKVAEIKTEILAAIKLMEDNKKTIENSCLSLHLNID